MREVSLVALMALVVSSPACGSGGSEPEPEGTTAPLGGLGTGGVDASQLPYEPCEAEAAVGQFVIELAPDFTRVGGRVFDAVLPSRVPNELAREGQCRLLAAVVSTCTPGCPVSTQACDRDARCVPLPRARDLGRVAVYGLHVPLGMTANAVTKSYANPAAPMLPNPGFSPGADLRLVTAGGEYAPFELRGWGITALAMSAEDRLVAAGRALPITWDAPERIGPARLHVELDVNQHGATSSWVECDFPDTGAAEIPASLIDGLIARGLSGYPTLTAARRTATRALIEPGCVDLLVTSEVVSDVRVDGIVSCDVSADCPAGQTCLPVERLCE